ncbi:NADPH-dependent FMN reductase [Persicimonas caeni]|uniref:NADPH-dependent FMN reductase n=1 Tax=Persicimonas caeni TaxID=2292766 RepID=UPI00143D235C|nr:NADPH-dependent FMN reductase [Persicimonas caeni]
MAATSKVSKKPKKQIVTISGTSRPNNYTSKVLALVNDELDKRGVKVVHFDARELDLSFPGQPETDDAKRLTEAVKASGAVVLASPEYHGTFTAMTKLIVENLGFPSALKGKPVALLGVASGRIGAIKTLEQMRGMCGHVGALVLPSPISVAGVRNVFNEDGTCNDETVEQMVRGLAETTLQFMHEYVYPRYELEQMVRGDEKGWSTTV